MTETTKTEARTFTVAMALRRHPPVGRGRIYGAMRSGALASVSVGKRRAIDVGDLDRWVEAGCPVELEGRWAAEPRDG